MATTPAPALLFHPAAGTQVTLTPSQLRDFVHSHVRICPLDDTLANSATHFVRDREDQLMTVFDPRAVEAVVSEAGTDEERTYVVMPAGDAFEVTVIDMTVLDDIARD